MDQSVIDDAIDEWRKRLWGYVRTFGATAVNLTAEPCDKMCFVSSNRTFVICRNFELNFPQAVLQHTLGMVGILCGFWKLVKFWLSYRHQLVVHFLGHSVHCQHVPTCIRNHWRHCLRVVHMNIKLLPVVAFNLIQPDSVRWPLWSPASQSQRFTH